MPRARGGTRRALSQSWTGPFGDFLAERLAQPLSSSGAARLTVAAHLGGLVIHLWRHWGNAYEMRRVGTLADLPSELLLCATGHLATLPASALVGYVPEVPRFCDDFERRVPIGWDTGHHVALLCQEAGWFPSLEPVPSTPPRDDV
jgi:hypothetical protein